jgi:D-alanyl-lipoteichoic acid acyltransferase DltB (MBOAT superfamily)
MDSASLTFLAFGLAVALISNLNRSRAWRSIVLLAASIAFLGTFERNLLAYLPLVEFLALGYSALLLLELGHSWSRVWSITTVIAAYVLLKKYTFLPPHAFLDFPYLTLGLSYIFFRVLHLLIEAENTPRKERISPGAYLLYNLNFTTFVAGPIQRYDEFARDQFAEEPVALGPRTIGLQIARIIRGSFKVNVLAVLLDLVRADTLAQLAGPLPLSLKLFPAFQLAIVYPLFLYANFSGYIDIVIAFARLMRIRLPENFDRPFAATSVLDFWNRWHMTLSNWLKIYVYNPLLVALMRRFSSLALQPFLAVFCYFVTFFLIGLWHGRTSEFLVFGVLTGGGMSINKLWQLGLSSALGRKRYQALSRNYFYEAFGRGLNFVWFAFTLFWFWGNWKQIDGVYAALGAARWLGVWFAAWMFASIALASWEWLRAQLLSINTADGPLFTGPYMRTICASAEGLVVFAMTVLLRQPAPSIVYKVF